jgi:hypothetical protein
VTGRAGSVLLCALVAAILALTLAPLGRAAASPDRLERFRALTAARVHPPRSAAGRAERLDDDPESSREIYALLDAEIVESLASGGPFASPAFLQDRLDAFTDAWGGAFLKIARAGSLVVGAFQLGDGPSNTSVRVYGRLQRDVALLVALQREGRPVLYPLPSTRTGGGQFVVAWEGLPTGRGTRPLALDLVRQGPAGVGVAWSTAEQFPDPLMARAYAVRGTEIHLRYELRYPGWTPGCERQTEQEEMYRLAAEPGTFVRTGRRIHDPWHRELRAAVARLLAALASGDVRTVASLVPDATLRRRLPATLRAEPACDSPDAPDAVSVAATSDEHRAWSLTFARAGGRWRLRGATPVLE